MGGKIGDIKLIVSFVGRGQGNGLARFYAEHHVSINFQSIGTGTASSELLDVLGIGSSEKDVIFSLASRENARRLMNRLNDNLPGSVHAKGIVFMMPITGINHILAVILKRQGLGEGAIGGTEMEQNSTNSLILVVVNQGHTDEVMNTARGAGARGGTIMRSRLVGAGEQEQQPLPGCSTWESGHHTLTGKQSGAGSGGMGAGELPQGYESRRADPASC